MKEMPISYYLYAVLAIMVFALVMGFVLARSHRPGREARLGLGLISLGVAYVAVLAMDAGYHDNWAHFRDVLLLRSGGRDLVSAGVIYVTFVTGTLSLIHGVRRK
jgi:hypothetical protein